MNIIKRIGVFFTSLFLVLSITATSSFADGHAKTILFSIKGPGSGNAFWASVEQGAKDEAKKLGVKLVLIAPPQEGDVQSQINQVEDQLAKGVDAMALAPADPNAFAPIVDDAIKSGAIEIRSNGNLINLKFCHGDAPSISAASFSSDGID